ncbi:hypothetical protein [Nocardioides sp. zg-1228]|uniref:hypothetical protein n=1 Tax=Nocardioides sp. zg-1228 TaxID=2763008 RepID=UPI0016426833|nr:hypothetical protein [Nocardioides sp. zg-1228]MBC2935042.1 hypothetical protein [Nocardioides sp. zg-1228]QSF59001.1 hypothetical protein JX575_07490 [Nocardioides sp. zg-1228]
MSGRHAFTSRPVGVFTVVVTGVIGVGALYLAATRAEQRLLNLVLGAFMVSVAAMVGLGQRRSTSTWRRTELRGRPAWALALGERGQAPAVAVVLTTLGIGLGLAAVLDERTGVRVVAGVPALLVLVLAAEMWRAWSRRPELRISADLVELHGIGIDSELAWDDVGAVVPDSLGTRWAALVLTAAAGAPSYRWRPSRLLLPLDREPDPPGIHLRVGLVAEEAELRRLLRELHIADRARREALIGGGMPSDAGF